jgi:transcriptional regulator with XRE-family HTH domain
MAGRTTPLEEGRRIAEIVGRELADELRNARLGRGLTQAQLGKSIGVDRERVSAVERRRPRAMTVEQLALQAAVLGMKLSVKLYPLGDAVRDIAQIRYINRFIERVGAAWRVALDVPIPLPGDLRAIDVVLTGACVIAVEVVTRLRDVQAVIRSAQLKQRDFGATRVVIVVAGTHANRKALALARSGLGAAFDLDSQQVLRLLASGNDPGRDAIILLNLERASTPGP